MAMRTRLRWQQEKCLQNYFGGKQLCLLYKASVQKFDDRNLLWICENQGPTMVVVYGENRVIGMYLQEGFQEKGASITVFALQQTGFSLCEIGRDSPYLLFVDRNTSDFCIMLNSKAVIISAAIRKKLRLPVQNSITSIQECEAFRCDELLDERKTSGIAALQSNLLHALRNYKPYGDLVEQTRVLLLGPIGAGKSSFVNSVKSVFKGSITHQALVGCDENGISDKYRTYSIFPKDDSGPLPFVLCDSLGLGENAGLHTDEVYHILKGHTPDKYQFNSMKPIISSHPNYIRDPLLKDRIHCVVFVFDINSFGLLSCELVEKIKQIRRDLIKHGIPHLALLTQVDSLDQITKGDLVDIYNHSPVKSELEAFHRLFGFALSDILVVSNYVSEWQLDPVKDMLILSALKEILYTANEFLEDLPLNK
ncbi:interferon-induced protein 44-like isoform X1 [Mastomys coucha]|uniref:interferon-induced protein 44-like isoform X1 n=1 Tax=Mastomys coucha TaxID=35658 RepID=UPI001261ED94|nr:interferon-induced protein 44-like isoform X1 [Mastomys coucha]XP_031231703.1 interferon-induced protein 44-like isoform X1 [Mastomys coucha]